MHNIYILGHRGASGTAPENTESAFKKALQNGADGVELDIHLTKDKELVVIHDERVDRTTNGTGYVKDLTLREIKKLDAGSYFSPQFARERILTLGEALEIINDCKIINIEIKNNIIRYHNIEEKIINMIKQKKLEDKIICSSFNHYSIHKMKKLASEIKTGLLYLSTLYQPWVYAKRIGAEAIHPYYFSVSLDIIKGCHKNKIKVNVWTVDDRDMIKEMIKNQVDIIITNYPEIALEILKHPEKSK
ncbi:MAG: glycerophosphodiester phosphodiesterase [Atribacterota bacterium]